MKKDPVCGATFDVRAATVFSRYRDRYYYFCSLRCHDAFAGAPHDFIQEPPVRMFRRPHRRKKAA